MTIAGVPFRVRRGRKSPTDLVLDWMTPEMEWRPVPMSVVAMMADFWFENGIETEVKYCEMARWRCGQEVLGL